MESSPTPEHTLRLFIDSVVDYAIFLLDRQGRVWTWNPGAERIKRYRPDEILGRHVSTFYPEEAVRERRPERALKIAAERGRYEEEGWRVRSDGSRFWAHVVLTAVRDDAGRLLGFGKVTRDLSERQRTQQQLQAHADRLAAIISTQQDIISGELDLQPVMDRVVARATELTGAAGGVVELVEGETLVYRAASGAAASFVGLRLAIGDSLSGLSVRSRTVLRSDDTEHDARVDVEATRSIGARSMIVAPLFRKGAAVGALKVYSPRPDAFADEDVETLQLLATVIAAALARAAEFEAERRLVEERTAALEWQRFLADAGQVLASSLDYEETLAAVARAATERIADWCVIYLRREGTLERSALLHSDPDKAELARALTRYAIHASPVHPVQEVIATGAPVLISRVHPEQVAMVAQDEEHRRLLDELGLTSYMAVPLCGRDRVLGALTFASASPDHLYDERDLVQALALAERAALAIDNAILYEQAQAAQAEAERRAEEEAALRTELETVTESRTRLIRGFSHDLKNPLGAADGYAALLAEGVYGELSEQQVGSVERIRASIRSALGLIEDLVELARAEAGQIELDPVPVDLAALAGDVAEDFRAAAQGKQLGLTTRNGVPLEIRSDPARVRQILGNLLSNAVKYTDQGRVEVELEEQPGRRQGDPERWAAVTVRDTGPGIPEEKQRLLFREFSRLAPEEKHGAGLGLAISQRIAEALGGRITLRSEVGQGSAFTLWLPLDPPGHGA